MLLDQRAEGPNISPGGAQGEVFIRGTHYSDPAERLSDTGSPVRGPIARYDSKTVLHEIHRENPGRFLPPGVTFRSRRGS